MNKFVDWFTKSLNYIIKTTKLYAVALYNKIKFLLNKNFTLSKVYKPIIKEKKITNHSLKETLKCMDDEHTRLKHNISKLQNENALLQAKISLIQDLLTAKHD